MAGGGFRDNTGGESRADEIEAAHRGMRKQAFGRRRLRAAKGRRRCAAGHSLGDMVDAFEKMAIRRWPTSGGYKQGHVQ